MLPRVTTIADLSTPALVVDTTALARNLDTMSAALPGARLRPHVKAHKCTALAARQAALGHTTFTCATTAEMEGMARAGLGSASASASANSGASGISIFSAATTSGVTNCGRS